MNGLIVRSHRSTDQLLSNVIRLVMTDYKHNMHVIKAEVPWGDPAGLRAFYDTWLPEVSAAAGKKLGPNRLENALDKTLQNTVKHQNAPRKT